MTTINVIELKSTDTILISQYIGSLPKQKAQDYLSNRLADFKYIFPNNQILMTPNKDPSNQYNTIVTIFKHEQKETLTND